MSNNRSSIIGRTLRQPLAWALLLSLLAHVWLVGGFDVRFDSLPAASWLQVELMPPPPAPAPVIEDMKPPPAPAKPRSKPPAAKHSRPEPAQPAPSDAAPAASSGTPAVTAEAQPAAPVAEPVPPAASAPADWPPAPVEEAAEEAPASTPGRVEIDFQIKRKGGVAGIERHRYQADGNGGYTLTSEAEAKGLLALVLSDLVQKSTGRVTDHGLQPEQFFYQYGKNPDKAQKASFDWAAGTLQMEAGSKRQSAGLQTGTQDLMSFMYQFMFRPPLQDMQISVTNGKRLKTYFYGFEGEETLETGMGSLRTLHIGRSNNDDEKTELWLAMDYHYLPVKISKTEKDGTVTERIATRLKIE